MTAEIREALKDHPDTILRHDWIEANLGPLQRRRKSALTIQLEKKIGINANVELELNVEKLTFIDSSGQEFPLSAQGKTLCESVNKIFELAILQGRAGNLVKTTKPGVNTGLLRDIITINGDLSITVNHLEPQKV